MVTFMNIISWTILSAAPACKVFNWVNMIDNFIECDYRICTICNFFDFCRNIQLELCIPLKGVGRKIGRPFLLLLLIRKIQGLFTSLGFCCRDGVSYSSFCWLFLAESFSLGQRNGSASQNG